MAFYGLKKTLRSRFSGRESGQVAPQLNLRSLDPRRSSRFGVDMERSFFLVIPYSLITQSITGLVGHYDMATFGGVREGNILPDALYLLYFGWKYRSHQIPSQNRALPGGSKMKPTKKVKVTYCKSRQGWPGSRRASALIVSLMFVLIFSALAISMMAMSGTNVQLASNHHNVNNALEAAQSGQQVLRYWLSRVLFSSSTVPANYFSTIIAGIKNDLSTNGITNMTLKNDGSIGAVTLDSNNGLTFDGQMSIDLSQSPPKLRARVTGHSGDITRTITILYSIQPYTFPIFNYGLATKGPVSFPGNPTITAVNSSWEADIFIESSSNPIAMQSIGNLNFDGNISIGNPIANVDFQSSIQIAGDTGQTAIDNHVSIGNDSPEFPVPDVDRFRVYATGSPILNSSDPRLSAAGPTLTNVRIKGGVNPVFQGSVIINGVLFIESPNVVIFKRNVALNGLIAADGDVNNADPAVNRIDFVGNFASGPYPSDPMFDVMRAEEGTSILAPGFSTSFSGNFSALEGVVAVSGAHFSGNVNAQIKGSIINYSGSATVIEGNSVMNFNRAGTTKIPAGFDLYRELDYVPTSYAEAAL